MDEASHLLHDGERLLDEAPVWAGQRSGAYHALGRACLLLGRLDDAQRFGNLAIAAAPWNLGTTAHALQLLGDVATHPERFDAGGGESRYREALALAEPRGMRPLVAHCHLGLGELYRRTDKREQAQCTSPPRRRCTARWA